MNTIKKLFHWITMDSCAHFASLKVKTDSAEEQNLLDGIYAPDSDKQQVEHICNL